MWVFILREGSGIWGEESLDVSFIPGGWLRAENRPDGETRSQWVNIIQVFITMHDITTDDEGGVIIRN